MSNNDIERYNGKPFRWGGKTYLFAPIGFGYMQRVLQTVKDISEGKLTEEQSVDAMKNVIHRSLQRNYPEMTNEFIDDEILDLTNMKELYQLALEASGLKPVASLVKPAAENPPASTS